MDKAAFSDCSRHLEYAEILRQRGTPKRLSSDAWRAVVEKLPLEFRCVRPDGSRRYHAASAGLAALVARKTPVPRNSFTGAPITQREPKRSFAE